jgi:hypothetical protein
MPAAVPRLNVERSKVLAGKTIASPETPNSL